MKTVEWTPQSLRAALDECVAQVGAWTSHSIDLGHGVYTRQPDGGWREELFARIMRDFGFPNMTGLRILDLACLEGLFAIEYARRGATTVGVEGRQTNVTKALFARDALGLDGCTILREDIRNLKKLGLGKFDVVLCAGVLYHLEAEAAVELIRQIADSCTKLAIFDTHIAPETLGQNVFSLTDPLSTVSIGPRTYEGRYFQEHPSGVDQQAKDKRLWASLDNDRSFWFSKRNLYSVLRDNGFSAVYDAMRDIHLPLTAIDRVIFAVLK